MKTISKAALSRNRVLDKMARAYEDLKSRSAALANEVEELVSLPVFGQDARPGQVYALSNEEAGMLPGPTLGLLGNEERFTSAYYSDPLTAYATGWTDAENNEALTDFIAPRVPVGRRFEFKSAVNVEAFLSELNDERAIGSDFKTIEYKGTTTSAKTNNRGLKYRLDLDEEGGGPMTEELIVSRILQRLKRNEYRRALATLLNASAGSNTNVTWTYNSGTNATPQPDEDIRALIQTTQVTSGVFPNRLLIDLKSWNIRKKSYAQQALAAGAIYGYGRTVDDVVADQSIDGMMVSKSLYQSSEWVTPAKSYILPQNCVAFFAQDNVSRDDPTNLKRFVTPVADGDYRVYRQPHGAKFVDITVECYSLTVQTSNIGIGQLTIV